MALFNFFKKLKKQPKVPKRSERQIETKKKISTRGLEKQDGAVSPGTDRHPVSPKRKRGETAAAGSKLKSSRFAWRILSKPHVTEKSTDLTSENKFIFKILNSASKTEVKTAIEDVYGVTVTGVNKISVPGKKRRRGRHIGWKSGYAKAVVTLKQGDKIEVLPH